MRIFFLFRVFFSTSGSYFVAAEVLCGLPNGVGAALDSVDAAGSGVVLAHRGVTEEANVGHSATAGPMSSAAPVAAVAGALEVLSTQMDGLVVLGPVWIL